MCLRASVLSLWGRIFIPHGDIILVLSQKALGHFKSWFYRCVVWKTSSSQVVNVVLHQWEREWGIDSKQTESQCHLHVLQPAQFEELDTGTVDCYHYSHRIQHNTTEQNWLLEHRTHGLHTGRVHWSKLFIKRTQFEEVNIYESQPFYQLCGPFKRNSN